MFCTLCCLTKLLFDVTSGLLKVNDQFIAAKALFFQTEQQDSQSEWTLRMKVMEALRATLTTTTFTVPELASAASEHIAGPLSIQARHSKQAAQRVSAFILILTYFIVVGRFESSDCR
jgi:hypothetical protein